MVAPVPLPKGSIMKWNGNDITEHNRSELSIDYGENTEQKKRMVDGSLRKLVIAQKRTFQCSWDNLPDVLTTTLDNKWAARDIESFYNTQKGTPFTLTVNDGSVVTNYTVVFDKFDKSILKRYTYANYWKVSITLEEV